MNTLPQRVVALSAACILILCSIPQVLAESVPIPYVENVLIDGDSSDWPVDSGLLVSAFAEDAVPTVQTGIFAPKLRVAWNEKALLLLVDYQTTVPMHTVSPPVKSFLGDSIEVFLRTGSAWRNLVQGLITADQAAEPVRYYYDYRGDIEDWKSTPIAFDVAYDKGENHYEIAIPWEVLRITKPEQEDLQFRINLNKILNDGSRRQLIWKTDSGADFQRLALQKEAVSIEENQAIWATNIATDRLAVGAFARVDESKQLSISHGEQALATLALSGSESAQHGFIEIPRPFSGTLTAQLSNGPQLSQTLEHPGTDTRHRIYNVLSKRHYGVPASDRAQFRPVVPRLLHAGSLPAATLQSPELYALAECELIDTQWFNAEHQAVTQADAPGLYVARTTVRSLNKHTVHSFYAAYLPRPSDLQHIAAAHNLSSNAEARQLVEEQLKQSDMLAPIIARLAYDHPYPSDQLENHILDLRKQLGEDTVYPFNALYPSDYDADSSTTWPAIIFLHGGSSILAIEGIEKTAEEILDRKKNNDLIGWLKSNPQPVLTYQLSSNGAWKPTRVVQTVRKIMQQDRIDPNRIIIMGFSMGGMGTWNTISEYADMFAAAVPLAGRSGRTDQMHRLGDLPVWIFNGDQDHTTTLADAKKGYEALKAAGGNVQFTTIPHAGHGQTMHPAWDTQELWTWLFAQSRDLRE